MLELYPELLEGGYVERSRSINDYDYHIYGLMNKKVRALLEDLGCVKCDVEDYNWREHYYGTNDLRLYKWLQIKGRRPEMLLGEQSIYLIPFEHRHFDRIWDKHRAKYADFSRRLNALIYSFRPKLRWK